MREIYFIDEPEFWQDRRRVPRFNAFVRCPTHTKNEKRCYEAVEYLEITSNEVEQLLDKLIYSSDETVIEIRVAESERTNNERTNIREAGRHSAETERGNHQMQRLQAR